MHNSQTGFSGATAENRSLARPDTKAYLLLTFAALLYGGNVVITRLLAVQAPPFTISALRGLLGFITLAVFLKPQGIAAFRPGRKDFGLLCLLGFLGPAAAAASFVWALQYSSVTKAAIVAATNPSVTVGLLAVFWRVKPTRSQMAGLIVSFTGIIVVFSQGSLTNLLGLEFQPVDYVLLVNALVFGFYGIVAEGVTSRFSSLTSIAVSTFLGTIMLLPLAGWETWSVGWKIFWPGWLLVLYMGCVASGLAALCVMEGIKRVGSSQAAMFGNLNQVMAILLGAMMLGERIAVYQVIGVVLVVTGVILSMRRQHPK